MTGLTNRHLAGLALALGVGAALTSGSGTAIDGRVDVDQLSRAVAREDDHVTAVELAAWIRDRKRGLRVIDLRTASEFESMHIPLAERIPIDSIGRASFAAGETVVLYSEGGAHSAQAWVFLRALGHSNVFFLRGGIYEWIDDVLNPTLPTDATDAEREGFRLRSELSRYFGGVPRSGVPRADKPASVSQVRRRTC